MIFQMEGSWPMCTATMPSALLTVLTAPWHGTLNLWCDDRLNRDDECRLSQHLSASRLGIVGIITHRQAPSRIGRHHCATGNTMKYSDCGTQTQNCPTFTVNICKYQQIFSPQDSRLLLRWARVSKWSALVTWWARTAVGSRCKLVGRGCDCRANMHLQRPHGADERCTFPHATHSAATRS